MMKKVLKVVVFIFILFLLFAGGGIFYLTRGLEEGKDITVGNINPKSLKDGVYEGQYKNGRWTNSLKITALNGKIISIDITKDVAIPKPEWTKELFDRVIEKQSTEVDVISGATVTSKAYLKSIEDALD